MDSLEHVFAVGPESPNDLDLLIRELAGRCGYAVVPSEWNMPAPTTVEDLVHYLAALYMQNVPERDKTMLLRSSAPAADESLLHPMNAARSDTDSLVRPLD